MTQHENFTDFLYDLVYDIEVTFSLTSTNWLRLRMVRTSGLLNEVEKQSIDRILHAVVDRKITLIDGAFPITQSLNYQNYKMLCQSQPAEYFCQLCNQLFETNTLSETDFQILQQAKESRNLNYEEEQIVKRIFYSLKRGRIQIVPTVDRYQQEVGVLSVM